MGGIGGEIGFHLQGPGDLGDVAQDQGAFRDSAGRCKSVAAVTLQCRVRPGVCRAICAETGAIGGEGLFIKCAEVGVMDDRINMLADELFGGPFEHLPAAKLTRRIMSMLSVATAISLV